MYKMASKIPIARKNCCNWNNGKCLGCMFKSHNGKLIMMMDKEYAGKPCAVDDGCQYFEEIVMKGVICT
jgi:hypothetical protein